MKTIKRCNMCGEEKPLDEFHCQRKAKDRRQSKCKTCSIAYARQWQEDNRAYLRLKSRIGTSRTNERCSEAELCP